MVSGNAGAETIAGKAIKISKDEAKEAKWRAPRGN